MIFHDGFRETGETFDPVRCNPHSTLASDASAHPPHCWLTREIPILKAPMVAKTKIDNAILLR